MDESPDFGRAIVDQAKIVDYLLGSSGTASVATARFFGSLGFSAAQWQQFAEALRGQAKRANVTTTASAWGSKHVAVGDIDAPNGGRYKIVSIWIEERNRPRLVTAYPAKG